MRERGGGGRGGNPSVITGTLLEQILAVKPIVEALAFTLQLNFSGSNNLFKL